MSLVIDLVLVAIVALCAWRGFRTGIINGVSWIIAVVIAIYGANLVASVYSGELADMLEPFALGLVDSTMNGDAEHGETDDTIIDQNMSIDERDKLDVYTVSRAVLLRLGIVPNAADSLARQTAQEYTHVGNDMSLYLTQLLCQRAAFVVLFAVAFILIAIVFTVIGNVFDLSFGIPGHENLNHIIGAALGAIRGILIIMVIGCVGRYIGILLPEGVMENTLIFQKIVDLNRIASMLKI